MDSYYQTILAESLKITWHSVGSLHRVSVKGLGIRFTSETYYARPHEVLLGRLERRLTNIFGPDKALSVITNFVNEYRDFDRSSFGRYASLRRKETLKVFKEEAGVIAPTTMWVCTHGPYLYESPSALGLIIKLITEWEHEDHLVG